ncbi:MAG: hypothetical protein WBO71_05005, partial [Thermoanaerobaculia bacterium]
DGPCESGHLPALDLNPDPDLGTRFEDTPDNPRVSFEGHWFAKYITALAARPVRSKSLSP